MMDKILKFQMKTGSDPVCARLTSLSPPQSQLWAEIPDGKEWPQSNQMDSTYSRGKQVLTLYSYSTGYNKSNLLHSYVYMGS